MRRGLPSTSAVEAPPAICKKPLKQFPGHRSGHLSTSLPRRRRSRDAALSRRVGGGRARPQTCRSRDADPCATARHWPKRQARDGAQTRSVQELAHAAPGARHLSKRRDALAGIWHNDVLRGRGGFARQDAAPAPDTQEVCRVTARYVTCPPTAPCFARQPSCEARTARARRGWGRQAWAEAAGVQGVRLFRTRCAPAGSACARAPAGAGMREAGAERVRAERGVQRRRPWMARGSRRGGCRGA